MGGRVLSLKILAKLNAIFAKKKGILKRIVHRKREIQKVSLVTVVVLLWYKTVLMMGILAMF